MLRDLGRVPDHVQNQTHEAVDKIFPCPGLLLKAALQQIAVNFGECHAIGPLVTNNCPLDGVRSHSILDTIGQDTRRIPGGTARSLTLGG